jgi:tetratricopeptide (TPR) repeat protein
MWNLTTKKLRHEAAEDRAHSRNHGTPKLYAQVLRSLRKAGEATIASLNAIPLDPVSSSDHIDRGNAYLEAGRLERAIAEYSKAIELDGQSAIAYNNRGVARAVGGEQTSAIADYDRAAAIDPDNGYICRNRGNAYRELGDYERAIADFTRAVETDPTCAEAYCGRGTAHQGRNEVDLARADFDRAIGLDQAYAPAHLGRGRICAKRGEFEAAIASFTRAIEIDGELASAYTERGHAHLGAHNFSHAAADYGRAMQLDPTIAENLRAGELALELRPGQSAQTPAAKSTKPDGLTVAYYDYLQKPNGFYVWLVPFDPKSFAARPPRLAQALQAALTAYRKQQAQGILDALETAEGEPLVDLFRGIAEIAKSHIDERAEHEAAAERHFRSAAQAGDDKACAILATLLASRMEGIGQDVAQAQAFAQRAHRSNDAFAIRQSAVQALSGTFAPADPSHAADLMWTAAELGDPVANAMLAAFFNAGTGLEQDHAKAERYLRRAADLGMTDAQNLLGDLLCRRYAKKLLDTPEDAVRYLERSLNAGNSVWAASRLAVIYGCEGREYPWKNHQKALDYIPRCAPYSNYSIHFSLGSIHRGPL